MELCYVWIIAFAKINLPMAITVNKIHALQVLCFGNLLILLIAPGKVVVLLEQHPQYRKLK